MARLPDFGLLSKMFKQLKSPANWLPVTLAFILALFFFGQVLLPGRMLMADDMISVVYMTFDYWHKQSGQWFPLSFGGFGLDIFSHIFSPYYPLSYVVKIFPPGTGAGLIPFIHFIVSFLGLYGFTRVLGISLKGSLLATIVWSCNSWFIYLGGQTGFFVSTAWIPIIFWALERLLQKANLKNLLIWAICLGLFLLQTHFQTIYYTALLCLPYTLLRLWVIWKRADETSSSQTAFPTKTIAALAIGGVLSLMIASPQLAASYQLKETTSRGGGMTYEESSFYGSLPPEELIGYYLPGVFGDWTNSRGFFEKPNAITPHYWGRMNLRLGTDYMGIIAFLLAAVGFWFKRKNPLVLFFFVMSVILTLTAFGKYFFFHRIFFEIIPLYSSFRAPARFMIFVTLFIAILVGFGLDTICKATREEFKKQFALMAGVGAGLLGMALLFFGFVFVSDTYFAKAPDFKGILDEVTLAQIAPALARPETIDTLARYWFLSFVFTGMVAVALLLLSRQFSKAKESSNTALQAKFLWVIVILAGLELVPFAKLYTRTIPADNIYYRPDAVTDFLVQKKKEGQIFRIFNQTSFEQFLPNKNILFDIESATGYQATIDSRYMDVMGLMGSSPGTFNLLNVRYLLFPSNVRLPQEQFTPVASAPDKGLTVFENSRVLPRFYIANDYSIETESARRLQSMLAPDVLEGRKIILEEKPSLEGGTTIPPSGQPIVSKELNPPSSGSASVEVTTYTTDQIELKVSNPHTRKLLFIGNTWSSGWQASINHSPGKLLRANHAFQAVEIPVGESLVTLKYENKLLRNLWIFGWALLGASIVSLLVLKFRRN